ncbi:MAG: prephenate dehydrogenase [Vicinamibacterales bacterium]
MGAVAPGRTVAIAGLGLIGLSVARAARRRWPSLRLVGIDMPDVLRHPAVAEALDVGAIDLQAARDADLVVLATPVDAAIGLLPELAGVVPSGTPVVDTCSTKRAITVAARAAGIRGFVPGHPMAGGTASGPAGARADLFDGRPWLLVRHGSGEGFERRVRTFVEGLGATAVWLEDAAAHDRLMAAVSHLPQVVASALMARVGEEAGEAGLAVAGAGLADTTRLAASPAALWEGVLAHNADQVAPLLRALAADLDELADALEEPGAVRRLFEAANRWKASGGPA